MSEAAPSQKLIYQDEDFILHLEHVEGVNMHFLHVQVLRWNKSVYKKGEAIFAELMAQMLSNGVDRLYGQKIDTKQTKFAKMFGFEDVDLLLTLDNGEQMGALVWQLEQQ